MSNFSLPGAIDVLRRTPAVLDAWLRGIDDAWARANEGPDTFTPFDVVGHLIDGEETDWIPRVKIILEHGENRPFDKFNREAQFAATPQSLESLLDQFAALRRDNLRILGALKLTAADLHRTGQHPAFGAVTLRQLLATWVAHDLDHVMQISRAIGRQYSNEVGPWRAYLRVISGQQG